MYMNADLEVKSHKTWVTNDDAVVNFEGHYFVFVTIPGNKFEMKEVETGVKEKGRVEILNGELFKDQTIVIKNAYTLLMALKNKSEE
jgi:cobalt-zinc-cadmium efflux system membrane fusion protein